MTKEESNNQQNAPNNAEVKAAQAKVPDFIFEILDKQTLAKSETPRANVIIAASYVEDLLTKLLKKFLVKPPNVQDDLFGSSKPLYNFGAKIELAYRLGLISSDFAWVLHRVRKLRDDCAHSHEAKDFNTGKMRDLIDIAYSKVKPEDKSSPATEDKLREVFTELTISLWAKINAIHELPSSAREFLQ